MGKRLLLLISRLIVFSGLHRLVYHLLSKRNVTILLYHDPAKNVFSQHMAYLDQHFNFITLDEYVNILEGKKPFSSLPDYPLIITFDDGHAMNYELADILRKYKAEATIYICTGVIGTQRKFWFRLPGMESRKYKKCSNAERLQQLQSVYGFTNENIYTDEAPQALSFAQIREMKDCVNFQAHTHFHPILTQCTQEELVLELQHNKDAFLEFFDYPASHFAYPNGNYTQREISCLKQLNYKSARSTRIGRNGPNEDPYQLKITGVSDEASLIQLKAELTGIPDLLYRFYQKLR